VAADGYRFEGVWVEAGRREILRDVSLDIPGSGLTCVAGPSGSGKSTLLRLCNRLGVPSRGRLLLDGADVAGLDVLALRRRAGMVFQRAVTFAGSVAENLLVAEPGASTAQLVAVLEQVALLTGGPAGDLLDRPADDLSGGEAQRLCIARALLLRPRILLLDEATSSLDVDARIVVEDLARRLVADGLSIVWVTHDLDQAERLADRIVVVVDGRVVPSAVGDACVGARSFTPAQAPVSRSAE
jgi:putative ABC transport system ATP-binding protein